MKAKPPATPRCRKVLKSGRRCGHPLEPDGDFFWCSRNSEDVITGRRGCGIHWVREVVDKWPDDAAESRKEGTTK